MRPENHVMDRDIVMDRPSECGYNICRFSRFRHVVLGKNSHGLLPLMARPTSLCEIYEMAPTWLLKNHFDLACKRLSPFPSSALKTRSPPQITFAVSCAPHSLLCFCRVLPDIYFPTICLGVLWGDGGWVARQRVRVGDSRTVGRAAHDAARCRQVVGKVLHANRVVAVRALGRVGHIDACKGTN